MTGRDPDVDVAVVGAGIGGLTLTLALRAHGITAEVFEQAGELREIGAAVALAANGSRILQRLGLDADLAAVSVIPTALSYRQWRTGASIARHRVGAGYAERFRAPFWGLQRAELQRVLSTAVGAEHLHLGRRLVAVRTDGSAADLEFAEGGRVRARIAVGADGMHSVVRQHVAGDRPIYSGTSGFRGLVPVRSAPSLPDTGSVQYWVGPGAHLLHYQVGEVINFLAVLDGPDRWCWSTGVTEAAEGTLAAAFDGWHPAVTEVISAVPQSPRWGLFALEPLRRWHRGPALLLGDAAHAMVPHHGQGANQTIEDAAVLARCLAETGPDGYPDAFQRYERIRRGRTRAVQRASWDTSAALHLPDGPAAQARDVALRELDVWLEWIHRYDADEACRRSTVPSH